MNRNLVTISDKKYLEKGLTLYESLRDTQEENTYKLFYICMDDYTYLVINKIESNDIEAIHIEDLEKENFELRAQRNNIPSREALSNGQAQNRDPKYIQFCWSLAAYSCDYFINYRLLDNIYYLDADLFFYKDFKIFDQELNNKSVGIVRHRIDYLPSSGESNVGVVYFKGDYIGKKCSNWWKKQLFSHPKSNPFYSWYGQCGDQKYLELFPKIFGDSVAIIDENVGHLAPWNATFHNYKDDKIIWNGVEQNLLYFHFAHFKITEESYKTSYNNEWVWGAPEDFHIYVKSKYDDYYNKTINVINKYNLAENK